MVRPGLIGEKHLSKDLKGVRGTICMRIVESMFPVGVSQCRGPNVEPWLAGASNNKESSVAGVEEVMKILVVADTKMYGVGQVAYHVETHGSS